MCNTEHSVSALKKDTVFNKHMDSNEYPKEMSRDAFIELGLIHKDEYGRDVPDERFVVAKICRDFKAGAQYQMDTVYCCRQGNRYFKFHDSCSGSTYDSFAEIDKHTASLLCSGCKEYGLLYTVKVSYGQQSFEDVEPDKVLIAKPDSDDYYLSTMYPCTLKFKVAGERYSFSCVEAAYQAMRCPEHICEFEMLNGVSARDFGKDLEPRADWDEIKYATMEFLINCKFKQNPELAAKLANSQGGIKNNIYGTDFECLGDILMRIRSEKQLEAQARRAEKINQINMVPMNVSEVVSYETMLGE